MKTKIHRKKQKPISDLSVSDLNRRVSHSLARKIRIKLHAFSNRTKKFYRDYRLPSIASLVFLGILLSVLMVRQLERTSLIALRNEVTDGGNGYSLLLSAEQREQFLADDTSEDSPNNETTDNSTTNLTTTENNSNSFTVIDGSSTPAISDSGSTGTNTGGSTTNTGGSSDETNDSPVEQQEPFASKIENFKQGDVSLKCSTPKPNKGTCSKVYTFSAGVRSLNGPGTVNYAWQSSIDSGNSTGSYSAGEGSTITSVSKTITLLCTASSSFTIQVCNCEPYYLAQTLRLMSTNCNEI
jgi:hypothetical protein